MAAPRYLSNLKMAVLAWPSTVRPEELSPSRVLAVVKVGTGSGSLEVTGASFDQHFVRVEIVTGGEPGVATFRARTDGPDAASGTWGDTLVTGANQALLHSQAVEGVEGADTGLRLTFAAGTPTPSFVAGDRWDFITRASPVVSAAVLAATSDVRSLIGGPDGGGQFTGDLLEVDPSIEGYVAALAALQLLEKRGFDPRSQDGVLYLGRADRATRKCKEIGEKMRFPKVTEGETRYAPEVHLGTDRYGIAAAHRGGRGC